MNIAFCVTQKTLGFGFLVGMSRDGPSLAINLSLATRPKEPRLGKRTLSSHKPARRSWRRQGHDDLRKCRWSEQWYEDFALRPQLTKFLSAHASKHGDETRNW